MRYHGLYVRGVSVLTDVRRHGTLRAEREDIDLDWCRLKLKYRGHEVRGVKNET